MVLTVLMLSMMLAAFMGGVYIVFIILAVLDGGYSICNAWCL